MTLSALVMSPFRRDTKNGYGPCLRRLFVLEFEGWTGEVHEIPAVS
jgi:hypothetical protein